MAGIGRPAAGWASWASGPAAGSLVSLAMTAGVFVHGEKLFFTIVKSK